MPDTKPDTIPASVQTQLDKANRLQKVIQDRKSGTQKPSADTTTDAVSAPVDEVTADLTPKAETTPDSAPATDVVPTQPSNDAELQRLRSFEGRAKRELQELRGQLEHASEQSRHAAGMADELKRLRAQVEKLSAPPPTPEPEPPSGATAQDIENFGTEMPGFVERVADQRIHSQLMPVLAQLKALNGRLDEVHGHVGTVETSVQRSAIDVFKDQLARAVPDYEQVHQDLAWREWLRETDPLSGQTREALINSAINALDAGRVATFFNAFKASTQPSVVEPAAPTSEPHAQSELQLQVSPPKSKATTPSTAPAASQRTFTQKEIQKFYDDQVRGKISGVDAERMEREIIQAAATGRVRR